MPRNMLEDIKPATKKMAAKGTVVPIRKGRVSSPSETDEETRPAHFANSERTARSGKSSTPPREIPFEPIEPKHSSRYALWYVAVACLIGFFLSLSFLFEYATVTITPKSLAVAFDSTDVFTAKKDATDTGTIVYTVMALNGDESIKLPGTQAKEQSISATGTVILYNAYQAASYSLVKGTRLATPDGRIYRINSATTIPGYTKSAGTIIPGSISVLVTAAIPGEAANLAVSDFTLPGLAGTAQATKIYGRTRGPITGGVSGTVYTIPQDAANAALGTLREKLKSSLISKAKVQVPDGYLYYDGATNFTTGDSVQVPYSKEKDIPIALSGTLTVYLIKEDTLVSAIAQKSISQYNNEPVTIPKLYSLTLVPTAPLMPETDASFSFTLSGSAPILWTIDSDSIKTLLAGKKKADFQNLIGSVVGVDRAELVIKPFWKRSFPEDPERITIVIAK